MKARTLVLTFILATLPLAGCIEADLPGAAGLDPAAVGDVGALRVHSPLGADVTLPDGVAAAQSRLLDVGYEAAEPTLGVLSDGTILYAAAHPGAGGFVTDIVRSSDGGLTWEDVTPEIGGNRVPPTTGDPYIHVDPTTDRAFSLDMHPSLSCSFLSMSDDGGDSWMSQPAACMGNPPVYDHQTITTGAPRVTPTVGYPNVVYQCINRITDSQCARSLDGGITWSTGVPVFTGVDPMLLGPATAQDLTGFCGGLHGHVVTSPDGTVFLPREYCGRPAVGISVDDGLTWQTVIVADAVPSNGPDPAVAVDAAGNVYYMFVTTAGELLLVVSTDGGLTWGEPLSVAAPAVTAAHLPAIIAGDDGRIAFAYTGTENLPDGYENAEFDVPASERADDGDINSATWHGYLAVVTDATSADPVIQTTRVNAEDDPLVRGYCGPGRCPGMYDFIDIVLDHEGRPFAAFVDACIDACAEADGSFEDSQGQKQGRAALMATLEAGPRLAGAGDLVAYCGISCG